ncbi:MAG: amidase [Planctomycetes bacterium]|nr:amidase [Planctomycetota bacterium]
MTALDEATLFLGVRDLGEGLRARTLTSVELTEAYLHRLETLGKTYNAVVTVTRDRALEQARRADSEIATGKFRGPLHGIPYGVKDLAATKGIPTTWGAAPLRHQMFDEDAAVVAKLEAAGAVLLGKLAMVELAGGLGYKFAAAALTGPGRNPWDTGHWTGGSSSGSGAAVAAGLCAFAIGSETWGSIVCPAAFCGVSGLRPTYGRVSRHGAMALSWTMDKLGVLARSAEDCGIVLEAIAGSDLADPSTMSAAWHYEAAAADAPKPKLGVVRKAYEKMEPEVEQAFEAALAELGAVATLEDVRLPDFPFDSVATTIIVGEASSAFEDLIESGQVKGLADPLGQVGGFSAAGLLAKDYLKAMRLRGRVQKTMDEILSRVDALVAPSFPCVSTPVELDMSVGLLFGDPLGAAGNAAGLPAISVPCGFGQKHLPVGIQFVGRAGEENRILRGASAYQSRTQWHRERPPAPR